MILQWCFFDIAAILLLRHKKLLPTNRFSRASTFDDDDEFDRASRLSDIHIFDRMFSSPWLSSSWLKESDDLGKADLSKGGEAPPPKEVTGRVQFSDPQARTESDRRASASGPRTLSTNPSARADRRRSRVNSISAGAHTVVSEAIRAAVRV